MSGDRAGAAVYTRRATRALRDLPAHASREALAVVSGLAAGDETFWRGIKRIARPRNPMFSIRIGIHYRAVFALHDGVLEVLDVLHRKDFDRMVMRA